MNRLILVVGMLIIAFPLYSQRIKLNPKHRGYSRPTYRVTPAGTVVSSKEKAVGEGVDSKTTTTRERINKKHTGKYRDFMSSHKLACHVGMSMGFFVSNKQVPVYAQKKIANQYGLIMGIEKQIASKKHFHLNVTTQMNVNFFSASQNNYNDIDIGLRGIYRGVFINLSGRYFSCNFQEREAGGFAPVLQIGGVSQWYIVGISTSLTPLVLSFAGYTSDTSYQSEEVDLYMLKVNISVKI